MYRYYKKTPLYSIFKKAVHFTLQSGLRCNEAQVATGTLYTWDIHVVGTAAEQVKS